MTAANAIETINGVGKGFGFYLDVDTKMSRGMTRTSKRSLIEYLEGVPAGWQYQVVVLKSEAKVKITETRY